MTERVRVGSIHDVAPGTGKELVAGGRIVALFNVDGQLRAIDGICAHAGGPIGKGVLKGCIVTCPWHGWQYDVNSGTSCLSPRVGQESFPVTVVGEDVFVDLS